MARTHALMHTHGSTEARRTVMMAEKEEAQIVQAVFKIKEETLVKNCNHAVLPK